MVDVLLAHSNHLFHDRKQAQKMQPYPPLQTLLAAALLRENGFRVALCDVTLDPPEPKFEALLASCAPRMVVVCEDDFNFLTKMCLGRNRDLSFRMAQMARARGIPTAVHGSDSSDHAGDYLGAGFDSVLIGEVEASLLELVRGKPAAQIDGLAFADPATGQPRFNKPRALRTDLDSLPFPAWDLVDIESYREAWTTAHGFFSLNIVSSRGCPYRCNWCAKPIWGDNYHARSPRLVKQKEDAPPEALYSPGPPLVRRRYLRTLRAVDPGVCNRCGIAGRPHAVQDAIALRPDHRRASRRFAARGLQRSMDGRGIRFATHSRCHGQGHPCG